MNAIDSISFDVDLNGFRRDQIYSVLGNGSAEHRRYIQTNCSGYGHVALKLEPWIGNHHVMVVWDCPEPTENDFIKQGSIATGLMRDYFPKIVEGVQAYTSGVKEYELPGPLIHVRITITGGTVHAIDSRSTNYQLAAYTALSKAVDKAGRVPVES